MTNEPKDDEINNPSHYQGEGMQALDVIKAFKLGYHLGNVVKYVLRADRKHASPLKCLRKARFYLDDYIKELESNEEVSRDRKDLLRIQDPRP